MVAKRARESAKADQLDPPPQVLIFAGTHQEARAFQRDYPGSVIVKRAEELLTRPRGGTLVACGTYYHHPERDDLFNEATRRGMRIAVRERRSDVVAQ
jgi:hypothetical protein